MSVSIITPMYNEEINIKKCYNSLIKQTYKNFEWIIIDDGSSDKSIDIVNDIIRDHSDEFTIKLTSQDNSGIYLSRKNALKLASYDYVIRLDADDSLSSNALAEALGKVNNDFDFISFRSSLVYNDKKGNRQLKKVDRASNYILSSTGLDAFSHCIYGWGWSANGLVKKNTYLSAYNEVDKYLKGERVNYADELVSRFIYLKSKNVCMCDGIYYYHDNPNSLTRSFDVKLCDKLRVALYLNNYISHNFNCKKLNYQSTKNLLRTFRTVYKKYSSWKSLLSPNDKKRWNQTLNEATEQINLNLSDLFKDKWQEIRRMLVCYLILLKYKRF
ncbi:glycosyl transferase family 2 [Shewanella halifaxensis HAW-EB4]|uniref:Glycosyl transferase family 2 n=1 Tax=Shewanella halifaxensis (strain HAW-EB4) TaxID=458817 RepID=B0TNL4_SHEHH|nr:glycosyltransferase family 2 protein [Shewanella halifaxensis]ABZ78746.1 glycosyl transferase family 2 [Shewanella halifaxensis HAW-EB4]